MLKHISPLLFLAMTTTATYAQPFDLEKEYARREAIQTEIGTLERVIEWQEKTLVAIKLQRERGIEVQAFQLPEKLCLNETFTPLCKERGNNK